MTWAPGSTHFSWCTCSDILLQGKAADFMGISDALLGRKNVNGNPYIEAIDPAASLPGGEIKIVGKSLKPPRMARPEVSFSGVLGSIVVSSEECVIARVPYGAHSGQVIVQNNGHASNGREIRIAQPVADNL